MGCGASTVSSDQVVAARRQANLEKCAEHLQRLGVSKREAEHLYAVFDNADFSKDGCLQAYEFEKLLKFPAGSVTHGSKAGKTFRSRLFRVFDRDGDGEVTFPELLEAIFTFCTYTKYALIHLSFALLDTDGSGTIDGEETAVLMREITSDPVFDKASMEGMDMSSLADKDGVHAKLTELAWTQFALKYPAILYPASKVQEELRSRLLGAGWWTDASAKRGGSKSCGEVHMWVGDITASALQSNGLASAIARIRDGVVKQDDLASAASATEVKDEWMRWYGPDRGMAKAVVRTMSRKFTGQQLAEANAPEGSSSPNKAGPTRSASSGSMSDPASSPKATAKVAPSP